MKWRATREGSAPFFVGLLAQLNGDDLAGDWLAGNVDILNRGFHAFDPLAGVEVAGWDVVERAERELEVVVGVERNQVAGVIYGEGQDGRVRAADGAQNSADGVVGAGRRSVRVVDLGVGRCCGRFDDGMNLWLRVAGRLAPFKIVNIFQLSLILLDLLNLPA